MKKMFCIVLAALMLLGVFAGCGAKGNETTAPTAASAVAGLSAEQIIEKIYAQHKSVDLALVTMPVDLTDPDAVAYNLGLSSADKIADAAMSETMLGQPYSMAVVRVKDAADASAVAKEMFENIDMRKWICVMADTKTALVCGDVVMFFMASSDFAQDASTASMAEAFTAALGSADVIG